MSSELLSTAELAVDTVSAQLAKSRADEAEKLLPEAERNAKEAEKIAEKIRRKARKR